MAKIDRFNNPPLKIDGFSKTAQIHANEAIGICMIWQLSLQCKTEWVLSGFYLIRDSVSRVVGLDSKLDCQSNILFLHVKKLDGFVQL